MQRIKLVLLPGIDGTGLLFRLLQEMLPPEIEPVVIAYPDATAWGYAELLPFVLARMPQDQAFVVLGESFGGPLALRVAAARPAGLAGVILSASFISCPHAFARGWGASVIRPFLFRALPAYARIKARLGLYATPELAALSAQTLSRAVPTAFARRIQESLRIDVSEELKACTLPMLYIQGAHDFVVPGANLKRILAIRPDMQWVRFAAPHMVLQTQPALSANAITKFIEESVFA